MYALNTYSVENVPAVVAVALKRFDESLNKARPLPYIALNKDDIARKIQIPLYEVSISGEDIDTSPRLSSAAGGYRYLSGEDIDTSSRERYRYSTEDVDTSI